jgi:hypothetical protein
VSSDKDSVPVVRIEGVICVNKSNYYVHSMTDWKIDVYGKYIMNNGLLK